MIAGGGVAALEAALTHRTERPTVAPYVAEAIERQEAALRANREPEPQHRAAFWEMERIAGQQTDRSEAVRRAAIARERREQAGTEPQRAFGPA